MVENIIGVDCTTCLSSIALLAAGSTGLLPYSYHSSVSPCSALCAPRLKWISGGGRSSSRGGWRGWTPSGRSPVSPRQTCWIGSLCLSTYVRLRLSVFNPKISPSRTTIVGGFMLLKIKVSPPNSHTFQRFFSC